MSDETRLLVRAIAAALLLWALRAFLASTIADGVSRGLLKYDEATRKKP